MALVEKHFRRQVLRSAAEGVGTRLAVLRETEVGQLEVTLLINEDILRLQITVDDVLLMQILEHESNLR